MKSQHTSLKTVFLFCLIIFSGTKIFASHAAGGELSYIHNGGNSYTIRAVLYRDCFGIAAPQSVTVDISSASCGQSNLLTLTALPGTGLEITFPCPGVLTTCQGGTEPGIEKWIYEGQYSFPAQCADWLISFATSARNAAITTLLNPGGADIYLEARLNNLTSDNSSPQFTNDPMMFICINQDFHYNNGMMDPDGDSLVYHMIAPRVDANTPVTYLPGYSAQMPITSNPVPGFFPYTGDFIAHPTAVEVGVLAFEILDYRNGELMGSVLRDIQIYTISCSNSNPDVTGINGTTQESILALPGTSLCFDVFSDDADLSDTLTMEWNASIPGATFNLYGNYHPTGTFCWTPAQTDVRMQPYLFTVRAKDNHCPENGIDMHSFFIYVTPDSSFIPLTDEHTCKTYTGHAYWDQNSNGSRDSLEPGFYNIPVNMLPEDYTIFTGYNGGYTTSSWYDQIHTISSGIPPGWIFTGDSTYVITDTLSHTGLDFGINAQYSFNSIDLTIGGFFPRCATSVAYFITYENTGTSYTDGTIVFVMDSSTSLVSSNPVPDSVSGDSLIYHFTGLSPFDAGQIQLNLMLPSTGGIPLHFTATVEYDSLGNHYPADADDFDQIVSCSYDPNDKSVQPAGLYPDHRTLYGEELDYLVRFQNTGNDTAFIVRLQDFIDPSLDLNTFHIIGSSHDMSTSIYPNRMVEFKFDNILLPASAVDEPGSHGFVQYKISPKNNLSLPMVVQNNANIYFDSNPPVLTNTVWNTLVSDLSVNLNAVLIDDKMSVVIPNPFHEHAEIRLGKSIATEASQLRVMDALGQLIFTKPVNGASVQLTKGNLAEGIYFYEVISNDGKHTTGKFVVN